MSGSPQPDDPAPADVGAPATGELERLSPSAVALWRIGYALRGVLIVALAIGADYLFDLPVPGLLLAAALGLVSIVVVIAIPPAQHRAWGYRLRDGDLFLRHGLLMRTTTIVPHTRIQHVDTRDGPIDRWLGLAEVVVYTAGTRGAAIPIPALDAATAEALRDRLVALSGAGDAV